MTEQMISYQQGSASSLPLSVEPTQATDFVKSETAQLSLPDYGVPAGGLIERIQIVARKYIGFFKRLTSFLVVGGLGALVNVAFFTLTYNRLEYATFNFVAYLIAFILATEVSLLFNFMLNDQITFRHLRGQKRSWQMRCARFHVTCVGGTLLTLGISFSLLNIGHVPALFAQALALIVATAFNFAFHHLFTYRHRQEKLEETFSAPLMEDLSSKELEVDGLPQFPLKTLIIIPTYNEYENLPLLLQKIFSFAPEIEVLIVDDNSPDGTGDLAEQLSLQNIHIHVLHRSGKLGLGTAYIAGFKYAIAQGYDAAFEMDADFSHDPRHLPAMLQAIEHADLVIGSRYIAGGTTPTWSLKRRIISGSGNLFARFMLGIPVHDCTGGFRCYRRSVLENIALDSIQSRGYAFQVELTYRVLSSGFKITEVPITFMDRRLGVSKMSRDIIIEAFTYVLRERFSRRVSLSS